MSEAISGHCPFCQQEVGYETDADGFFCSICGRSPKLAEIDAKKIQRIDRAKKARRVVRLTLIIVGSFIFLIIVAIGFLLDPDRLTTKLVSTIKGLVGLTVLGGIIAVSIVGFNFLKRTYNEKRLKAIEK